ncbi:MAG: hypothetical protein KF893_00060 [Caldilineaceae bacterium]|nr:hypothetical protein [Caldilineaceae bacterium]
MGNSTPDPIDSLQSAWNNVYWFARMLINSDQYGGVGTNSRRLIDLGESIRTALELASNGDHQIEAIRDVIATQLMAGSRAGTRSRIQVEALMEALLERINSVQDAEIFRFACLHVMVPINDALSNIPNDDREFAQDLARSFLDNENEKGLATVINLWDRLGVEGSLNMERMEIIQAFGKLRTELSKYSITPIETDSILTAFVQEFERRVGQKRKSRGGRSLEDVTSFILDYFQIPTTHAPEHFQADIEVDKWIRTSDNWYIGISCKRTLRERWKQVSSADTSAMGRYKIRELWHVITHASSLPDDMLALLGGNRHVFYLPDDSEIYRKASSHTVLRAYVRPLTNFVQDLRGLQPRR